MEANGVATEAETAVADGTVTEAETAVADGAETMREAEILDGEATEARTTAVADGAATQAETTVEIPDGEVAEAETTVVADGAETTRKVAEIRDGAATVRLEEQEEEEDIEKDVDHRDRIEMRDRLFELQSLARIDETTQQRRTSAKPLLDQSSSNNNDSFEQFLTKIDNIRHVITTMSNDRTIIRRMQNDILKTGNDSTKCRELNEHVDRFIQRGRFLREKLEAMSNDLNQHYPEGRSGSARARHEQVNVLHLTFETMMTTFSEDQMIYREKSAQKIKDYLKMQNIEVTDSQIDDAIENGNLQTITLQGHLGVQQRKMLYEDVKQRTDDILVLEKQIREIAELFQDMNMLVNHQSETINRIESSVLSAENFAEKAAINVKSAIEMRRRNTKMKIVCLIISIILIIITLIFLQSVICIYTPIC